MTPSEIKPGMKFNHWEVIKFDHVNKHRILYYLCKCDVCGTIRPVRGSSLISGYSKACSQKCSDNLYGQKFGRWTVLKQDKSKKRNYICKCDCGTVRSIYGPSLKYGNTLSCGCASREHTKKKNRDSAESHIGEKYGWLTIEKCFLKGNTYWYNCKCGCGNTVEVIGKNLFNGNTSSCGCMNSKANELTAKILDKYNICYKREYRFEDCKDKKPLPFDFAVFNEEGELTGLIELNGSLHYSTSGTSWDTKDRLLYQQKHDYIKRAFCEKNRIPFLIVPYWFFNELEKFIITSDFWVIITKNFND
mgnify:FL=1